MDEVGTDNMHRIAALHEIPDDVWRYRPSVAIRLSISW